jgi:O-acetyl-ADP-ribose deacetylase (regulator of RNase III)
MDFEVIQGDIAQQSADVLVNAAGTSLQMGSGVAGALRRAAGEQINREAMDEGPVDLGEVAVTDAHDLDAEWVIHAAAMPHYGDGKATAQSIEDATRNALRRADTLGAESLVIPALGCGVAGFDLREGAEIIAEAIDEYDPGSLRDVRFIAYSDDEVAVVRDVAEQLWTPDDEDTESGADTASGDAEQSAELNDPDSA